MVACRYLLLSRALNPRPPWNQPKKRKVGGTRDVGWVLVAALVLCILATSLWLNGHKKTPTSGSIVSSSPTDTHGVLRLKGTTQAVRTRAIQAPLLAGDKEGTLTITNLRAAGSSVKQGDILVEFDRQAQLRDFLDKQAQNSKLADDVLQEEAKEDAARAKDETEIRVAEGDLAKAELEMQKVELLSRIDAEKAPRDPGRSQSDAGSTKRNIRPEAQKRQGPPFVSLKSNGYRARETMLHAQANAALMQVHSPISRSCCSQHNLEAGKYRRSAGRRSSAAGRAFHASRRPFGDGSAGSGQSAGCAGASRTGKKRGCIWMLTPILSVLRSWK